VTGPEIYHRFYDPAGKTCHFGLLVTDVVMIVSILPGVSDSDSLRGGRQVELEFGMLDLLEMILANDV
jgi:hypothetical protein